MKHDRLCSIGHNLADSMASGLAFVIGVWNLDVFGEAAASPEGLMEVDFLNGTIVRGRASDKLRAATVRFAEVFPTFCEKHGAEAADFKKLRAVFRGRGQECRVTLHVTDSEGVSSSTEYRGLPLKRLKVLDDLGRIRKMPRKTS